MGRRPASNLRRTIRTSELSYGGYRASTRHRDEDGKVRTVSAHGLTIADAEALLESKLKNRVIPTTAARGHPDVTDVILAEHTVRQAARIWLSKIDSDPTLADTTKLDYARIVRATLENRTGVGTVRLRDLTAGVIGRHIDGIANGTLRMSPALRKQSGTKDGPAPTQARNCRKVLRQILSLAVKDEAIPTNPTLQLDRIRGGRRPPRALTLQQVQQLRVAVSSWCSSGSGQSGRPRDSQLVEIVELLLATGMRIGEVLALRAEDVELASDIPFVRIRGTVVSIAGRGAVRKPSPKTPHSQADVALPEFGVIALKRALAVMSRDVVSATRSGVAE